MYKPLMSTKHQHDVTSGATWKDRSNN